MPTTKPAIKPIASSCIPYSMSALLSVILDYRPICLNEETKYESNKCTVE